MPERTNCRRSFIALLLATLSILPSTGFAQSQAAPVAARLFDANVAWSGTVGTRVVAQLERGGIVVASVDDRVRVNGEAWLRLRPVAGASPALIRPGDRIVLKPERLPDIAVTVPPLTADLAADGRSVFVHATPGMTVTLRGPASDVSVGPGPYLVGTDGQLRIPLAAPFDGRGTSEIVVWVTGGHAFRTGFAPLNAQIEVGEPNVTGRASAGATVQIDVAPVATQAEVTAVEALTSPWRVELPDAAALVPGTAVTVTKTSPAIEAPHILAGRVPVLNVAVVGGGQRIVGEGLPGATVLLAIGSWSPIEVRVDEGGQFSYELDEASALRPGEIIKASIEDPAGLTFYSMTAHTPMEVLIYGTKISAVIDVPGADVAVSLHDAKHTLKARGTAKSITTSSPGAPAGTFHFDAGVRIEPGDVITVDWGTGDPMVVVVPTVTAVADPVMDTVSGTAPPGTPIETAMFDRTRRVNIRHVTAGADGRFLVDYRGERDIGFGEVGGAGNGVITVRSGAGDIFDLAWAAVAVNIEVGQGPTGVAPSGREVRVVLRAPDGSILGTWDGQVAQRNSAGAISSWESRMVDSAGQPVEARPGDRWDITVADQRIALDMPRFSAALDVAGRRVLGQTEPGALIRAYPPNGVQHKLTTTADALGFFSVDLSEGRALRYDDRVLVAVVIVEPHDVTFDVRGAAMTMDLDALQVSGAHEPHSHLELTLDRAETAIARGTTRASPRGLFEAVLSSLTAGRIEPQESDRLTLSAPGAMGEASVAFELPELTVALDRAARAIYGRATVGGVLRVDFGPAYERHLEGAIYHHPPTNPISITADGTYKLELPSTREEGPDFRPGQFAEVQYTLPGGHRVKRRRYLPMANVHLGGAEVCGVGPPWSPVEAELRDSTTGQPLASARGTTDARGRYALVLRDGIGQAVNTSPKQMVTVALDGTDLNVPLQTVDITMTWAAERIGHSGLWLTYEGQGPPRRDYYEQAVRARCLRSVDEGASQSIGQTQTGASGRFKSERLNPALRPGQQFELAFYADSGHRYYVRGDRGLIRAEVGTERVTGRAVPFSWVSLVLRSASGLERATIEARAGVDGDFAASLRDGAGRPVAMEPGDMLMLATTTGNEEATIERVSFDFSETGLIGQAPPGRGVVVTLTLADGRELSFPRTADGSGRFAYGDAQRPPGADWAFADVDLVRVVLPTVDGHEMVAAGRIGIVIPRIGTVAFMPMTMR